VTRKPSAYQQAGVDIDATCEALRGHQDLIRSTFTPGVMGDVGQFGGIFDLEAAGAAGQLLVASTDGVGTKVKLARQADRLSSIGEDLVNHCVNDILVQGARPLFFLDYVAMAVLVPEVVAEIVRGMAEACRAAGCALLGGETAEMPGVYRPSAVDVAGTIVGVVDRADLLPRTEQLVVGDAVVAMASDSPHTNGYSLIRRLLDDHEVEAAMIDWLLTPHRSHAGDVEDLLRRGVRPKALAHITGGGFLENIPRVLPDHLGVRIELGSWPVPDQFALLAEWGSLADEEAFRVWNMGVGMVAVIDPAEVEASGLPLIGEVVARQDVRVALTGTWR
jgi:phosphoribosylaminoimidazole synthetase